MDKYIQAEYIFKKLNENGAGLGNASILIIKSALQDLEAADKTGECLECHADFFEEHKDGCTALKGT